MTAVIPTTLSSLHNLKIVDLTACNAPSSDDIRQPGDNSSDDDVTDECIQCTCL